MKSLIIANWKMNPSTEKEARELFETVKRGVKGVKNAEVVICPPFVYLPLFSGLTLGAQNVFFRIKGAFTGEVSALMLKDLKVKYVIVGHSEARFHLKETDETINRKIKSVLDAGLMPILCVGENKGEEKQNVIERQVAEALKGVPLNQAKNIVIAYEPVWAIGTGKNCSVEETMVSVLTIKKVISKLYKRELAEKIKVLYGGSVDGKNSGSYMKGAGVSGLLVGGNSLNAKDFIKIVKSVGFTRSDNF